MMTVSLCVVAFNEEQFLPRLLYDLEMQTYPHELTEIVLVDSNSTDRTKQAMLSFQKKQCSYIAVKVVDNPRRVQAAGWNLAIASSQCDVIIRIDAHTSIPPEFTARNMKLQESGEYVTGGVRPCVIENPTPWKNTLLEVENSLFGSSIGPGRSGKEKKYVKSMFHAAYRREVFEKAGVFNEKLLRTEDNEMHYRVRKTGYVLCFDPEIKSYQYARDSLKHMIRQKYGNGYWIGLTLGVCPGCISVYHLVPFCFIMGIVVSTLLAIFGIWQIALIIWAAYLMFTLFSMLFCIAKGKANGFTVLMPLLFLILHIVYGIGTLVGLVSIPFKKQELTIV